MSTSAGPPDFDEQNLPVLAFIGETFVNDTVGVICESVFWAVYLVLFAFAVRVQISRGVRTGPMLFMLAVTVLLFLSSTTLWVLHITVYFLRLKTVFITNPAPNLITRMEESNGVIVHYGLPMEVLFLSNMIIGDAVVIWRAWVLWQEGKMQKLVYIPMVMLATSFAFVVFSLNCLGSESYSDRSTIPGGGKMCQWGEPIAWGISLLTNVVTTTLIAVKAWQHRQFLKSGIGKRRKSRSEKVLVLLVESGFIYCFFWLSQLIIFFDVGLGHGVSFLYMVLSPLGDQLSGLYPTVIILLVNMQRSISNDTQVDLSSLKVSGSSGRSPYTPELSTIEFGATKPFSTYSNTTTPTREGGFVRFTSGGTLNSSQVDDYSTRVGSTRDVV